VTLKSTIIAGLLSLILSSALLAEESPDKSMQEKMRLSMELAQPGPEHDLLMKMVGTWDQTIKLWAQPGAEPAVVTGSLKVEPILGGRFVKADFVAGEGMMTTEGLQILGFDRRKKEYTIVGYDTWGTYYVTAAGPYDEKTSTITMHGEDYDPIFEGTQIYDMLFRFVNDDTFVHEIIFKDSVHTQGGPPFKMLEVTSTRSQ
jgi:hypothetical protein